MKGTNSMDYSKERRQFQRERAYNQFNDCTIATVNAQTTPAQDWDEAGRSESRTVTVPMKCSPTQKEVAMRTAREMGVTPSTLLLDALEFYLAFYPRNYVALAKASKIKAILDLVD
jgi:hypothetical protein